MPAIATPQTFNASRNRKLQAANISPSIFQSRAKKAATISHPHIPTGHHQGQIPSRYRFFNRSSLFSIVILRPGGNMSVDMQPMPELPAVVFRFVGNQNLLPA